jgi:Ca2+-binding RTX toxin-like protein
VFRGGTGDDAYYVDATGDTITENAGQGVDAVYSTASGYTLSANLETLTFVGSGPFTGVGNGLSNTITGGAGDDTLVGGGAGDALIGGAGVNTASYSNAGGGVIASLANVSGNAGDASGDTYQNIQNLLGSGLADNLEGDSQSNTLTGGAGADTITGGNGADVLQGDAGNDIYDFNSLSETAASAPDLINFAAGDKIDLSTIDADPALGGDQAFHLDGSVRSGGAGDVTFNYSGGGLDVTIVNLYVDSDTTIDATIYLRGNISLTNSSFIF